jgi:nicotinate-nucleotide pyrophosphorylase (carboxylating)
MNDQLAATIIANVSTALQEDLGSGDKTAELVPESTTASAVIICREPMTLAGQPWVDEVFHQIDSEVDIQWLANDGDHLPADAEICVLNGAARSCRPYPQRQR